MLTELVFALQTTGLRGCGRGTCSEQQESIDSIQAARHQSPRGLVTDAKPAAHASRSIHDTSRVCLSWELGRRFAQPVSSARDWRMQTQMHVDSSSGMRKLTRVDQRV